jgi:hypothetical protein
MQLLRQKRGFRSLLFFPAMKRLYIISTFTCIQDIRVPYNSYIVCIPSHRMVKSFIGHQAVCFFVQYCTKKCTFCIRTVSISTFYFLVPGICHDLRGRFFGRNPDKSLKSFPPCYSQTPQHPCLEISISSNSRNLLKFLQFSYCTL